MVIAFSIYSYFFCKLGNTCWRKDYNGIEIFNLKSLFNEGFIGPIRTILIFLSNGQIWTTYKYLKNEGINLANPYTAYGIVRFINNLLIFNKII